MHFMSQRAKTKGRAIKRFHSIQYFWAISSKTLWWSECGLETSFSYRAPSLDLGGQSQSGSSCLWLFPGSPACRHVSTSPVSSPTQDVAFAFQEFPETGGKKKKKGERERADRFPCRGQLVWKKRGAIKYCCFVYLTQFCKLAALWHVPICGFEDVLACGECKKVHGEKAFFLRRLNTSHPTFLPLHPSLAQTLVTHSAVVFFPFFPNHYYASQILIFGAVTPLTFRRCFVAESFLLFICFLFSLFPTTLDKWNN